MYTSFVGLVERKQKGNDLVSDSSYEQQENRERKYVFGQTAPRAITAFKSKSWAEPNSKIKDPFGF